MDRRLFGVPNPGLSRREVVLEYTKYMEAVLTAADMSEDASVELYGGALPVTMLRHLKDSPSTLVKPLMHLFKGMKHGGLARRIVAENLPAHKVLEACCVCLLYAHFYWTCACFAAFCSASA